MQPDVVTRLQRSIMEGGERLFDVVPRTITNVIKHRAWETRRDRDGKPFTSFEAFVQHRLWEGLNCSIEDLLTFCRKRKDVQKLINEQIGKLGEYGNNQHTNKEGGDIITSSRGTDPTYIVRRLKRDRPDIADRVIAGELSANAAAIEAGFRKKPAPFAQILKLLPKLTADERAQLRDALA